MNIFPMEIYLCISKYLQLPPLSSLILKIKIPFHLMYIMTQEDIIFWLTVKEWYKGDGVEEYLFAL